MADRTRIRLFKRGRLDWDTESLNGQYIRKNCRYLLDYIPELLEEEEQQEWEDMFNMIKKMRFDKKIL